MKNIRTIYFISLLLVGFNSRSQALESQIKYLSRLSKDIKVDGNYSQGNWKPILKAIGKKNLVLLGELNHGSKEIFITRNDLIKELHQKLKFDVILFESGFGEVGTIEIQKNSLTNKEMTYGFFGVWRTKEFEQLMDYTQKNNIHIGGYDVQKTGNNFEKLLEKYALNESIDSAFYFKLEKRFNIQKKLLTKRNAVYDSLKNEVEKLIHDYDNLLEIVINKGESKQKVLVKRTIENRIKYLQYFLNFTNTNDWSKRWEERDKMMASNIEWLLENLYSDKKVIIVGHNFHIAKFNKKEEVMGELLIKKYQTRMYSLGVFVGNGNYVDNSRNIKKIKPIEKDGYDIKQLIRNLDGKVNFIDIPKKEGLSIDFLDEPITINDTFIDLYGSNKLTLSKHFDGVLLLDNVTPAQY